MNRELVTLNEQGIPLLRVTQRMRLEQSQLDNLMRKMEKEGFYLIRFLLFQNYFLREPCCLNLFTLWT